MVIFLFSIFFPPMAHRGDKIYWLMEREDPISFKALRKLARTHWLSLARLLSFSLSLYIPTSQYSKSKTVSIFSKIFSWIYLWIKLYGIWYSNLLYVNNIWNNTILVLWIRVIFSGCVNLLKNQIMGIALMYFGKHVARYRMLFDRFKKTYIRHIVPGDISRKRGWS